MFYTTMMYAQTAPMYKKVCKKHTNTIYSPHRLYTEAVLPKVVHQIVQCKDDIAQQYLMQCLIQVRGVWVLCVYIVSVYIVSVYIVCILCVCYMCLYIVCVYVVCVLCAKCPTKNTHITHSSTTAIHTHNPHPISHLLPPPPHKQTNTHPPHVHRVSQMIST